MTGILFGNLHLDRAINKQNMKRISLLAIVLFVFGLKTYSQDFRIDLNDLINETQLSSDDMDLMRLVWWIPTEFWDASFAEDPSMKQSDIDEFKDVLGEYVMLAVLEGNIGMFGGITYKSRELIKDGLSIRDRLGMQYTALSEEDISPDARNLIAIFQPVFANMMGEMGENMQIFLFEAYDADGRMRFDPNQRGLLNVQLFEESFEWKLPLGALLPRKSCPVDGESLSGSWNFCPWHGDQLK